MLFQMKLYYSLNSVPAQSLYFLIYFVDLHRIYNFYAGSCVLTLIAIPCRTYFKEIEMTKMSLARFYVYILVT